jgi:hypothetical protein
MLGVLAAAVLHLGARPEAFVGADPQAYAQWLGARAIEAAEKDAGSTCPTATVTSLGASLAGPPIMKAPPPGRFIDTTVVEHLDVAGCGGGRRENFLIFRLETGEWMASRLLDGDSRAGPRLQHDAFQSAAVAFMVGGGCPADQARSTFRMGPARLFRPPGPDRTWDELWSASVCGRSVTVKLAFVPDAAGPGTSFSAQLVQPDGQPSKPRAP